jgi:hypothetical protein
MVDTAARMMKTCIWQIIILVREEILGSTPFIQVELVMEITNQLECRRPRPVMTHKYRGCIVVLSINKSVEPNEEQKVLMSSFD